MEYMILPGGPRGGVVFRNLVMERLSLALTGSPLHDMDQFRAAAGDGPLSLEGKVWQFDASPHPDGALCLCRSGRRKTGRAFPWKTTAERHPGRSMKRAGCCPCGH